MADWKKTEQLYEGKAKKVFATENQEVVIVDYKDDATAFNGEKKGTIVGKGVINNRMSNYIMKQLEKEAALRAAQEAEAAEAAPEFAEMPEHPFVDAEGEIEEAVDADFEVEK